MLENGLRGDIYQSYLLHLHSILGEELNPPSVDTAPVVGQNSMAVLDLLFNRLRLTTDERRQMLSVVLAEAAGSVTDVTFVISNDRAARIAHIFAMAHAVFGNGRKAKRWLFKHKARFDGQTPVSMLLTGKGTNQVEEMLFQIAEGYGF